MVWIKYDLIMKLSHCPVFRCNHCFEGGISSIDSRNDSESTAPCFAWASIFNIVLLL